MCGFIFSLRSISLAALMSSGLGGAAPLSQSAEQICKEAGAAIAAGRLDFAILQLRLAAHEHPNDSCVEFNYGLALSRKGRWMEAVSPLQRATKDPAFASEARFLLVAGYFASARYEEAIAELVGLDRSERMLYMLEESNRRAGHVEEAKAAFHELLTRYPDSAWTHYLMGTAYEDQQQLEKAVEEYRQALGRDAAIPNASFAIGYIYWRQQDMEKAREWLEKEARQGCHGLANYYLGEIARSEKEIGKAEALYRRAVECDASSGDAHLRLGTILEEQKRYREAAAELREAIRLQPNASGAHYHLAAVYRAMGRSGDSEREFGKVREIQAAKDDGVDVTAPSKQ